MCCAPKNLLRENLMNVKVTQYGVHHSLVSSVAMLLAYTIDPELPSFLLTEEAKPETTTGTR